MSFSMKDVQDAIDYLRRWSPATKVIRKCHFWVDDHAPIKKERRSGKNKYEDEAIDDI